MVRPFMMNHIAPFLGDLTEQKLDALGDKLALVMQRCDAEGLRQSHAIRTQMAMLLCGEDVEVELQPAVVIPEVNERKVKGRKQECERYLGSKLYSDQWQTEGINPGTLVEVNGSSAVVDHEHNFLGSRIGWVDASISRFSHAAFLKRIANGTLRVITPEEVEDILQQRKERIEQIVQQF